MYGGSEHSSFFWVTGPLSLDVRVFVISYGDMRTGRIYWMPPWKVYRILGVFSVSNARIHFCGGRRVDKAEVNRAGPT